ncbi:MAG: Gfo/Idh/MocA family oxidoreductase [Sphaerochaetaceae bacterium]|jgi:scyllo-inositol 2-dehydrogenase (NADP+)
MEKKIKAAIIGCGKNANELHTPILLKHPDFEMIGTYDIVADRAQKLAKVFSLNGHTSCKAYESREALLASDVEYVAVLTDSHMHTEVAAACLRAGKNVLITKPWALNSEDAAFIIDEAKKAKEKFGVSLMPFLPQNWGTDLSTIRDLISSGAIGKVYEIRRRAGTFGKRYDWQLYKKFGGGYLNNWGPHLLGQLMAAVDEPIVKVCAEKKRVIMDGDCEDTFIANMKTESGIILNCEHCIMVDKLPHWIVQGSEGTIFITDGTIDVHKISYPGPIDPTAYRSKTNDDNQTYPLAGQYNGDRYAIYTHMADVIRHKCEFAIPLTFTRNLTTLCDAIHKSADEDDIVRISPEQWRKPL